MLLSWIDHSSTTNLIIKSQTSNFFDSMTSLVLKTLVLVSIQLL